MVKKNSFGEHSMVSAKASVMIYSDSDKKWLPSGSSAGISKVSIYHHATNNTFRVVGRKMQDMEVVVNCSIFKSLKYNQATPTFHQWRDNRQVYGLNFANKEDADNFAQAMYTALDTLNGLSVLSPAAVPPALQQNTVALDQQQQQQLINSGGWATINGHERPKNEPRPQPPVPNGKDSRGHHRNSSADNILSQTTEMTKCSNRDSVNSADSNASQASGAAPSSPQAPPPAPPVPPPAPPLAKVPSPPPAPPCPAPPLSSAAPPPAPPPPPPAPPMPSVNAGGLAAALQNAQLRKVTKPAADMKEKEESSTSGNHALHSVTLGRSASCASTASEDIMSEMARRLRERRAKTEGTVSEMDELNASSTGTKTASSVNGPKLAANGNGTDSPRVDRSKRFQSLTGQESFHASNTSILGNGSRAATTTDLEVWKHEVLLEVRKEIQSVKMEIIEAIRCEIAKR